MTAIIDGIRVTTDNRGSITYHLPPGIHEQIGFKGQDLDALGIPSEQAYLDAYRRHTGGGEIPEWNFFMAFSLFRLAAIVQGVYKRGLDGNASAHDAKRYGAMVSQFSDLAWEIASR